MWVSIILAGLVSILASSLVLVVQGFTGRMADRRAARMRALYRLAVERQGRVTAPEVAQNLGLSPKDTEHFLRGLVDDKSFSMAVDDRAAALLYWYPSLLPKGEETHPESDAEDVSSSEGGAAWARPASTKD